MAYCCDNFSRNLGFGSDFCSVFEICQQSQQKAGTLYQKQKLFISAHLSLLCSGLHRLIFEGYKQTDFKGTERVMKKT